ncbi:hemolysin family protein [Candidatus Cloacimonadota bacterium]
MWLAEILLIGIFFILAGFFSGIETGLLSIDRFKLEKEARSSDKKKRILSFLQNPDRLFGTTLFGTNISIVIVSSLTVLLIHYLNTEKDIHISENYGTMIMAGLILIFAEIIPKAIYRDIPNIMVPRFFNLLNFFSTILTPFVKLVGGLNSLLAKIFNLPANTGYHLLTREDISYMLSKTENDENLEEDQREMLEEALEFTELKAENVMIHRTEIVALHKDTTISEVIQIAKREGFTRFPVFGEDLDDIVGVLIIYDLLNIEDKENLFAKDFLREAFFAPETMDVNKLLADMQSKKKSVAVIIDPFGGTAGLITIEDILEEIVGEIEDEYDVSTEEVEILEDGSFLIQGYVEIDLLNDEYDMNLPEGDYETIAGLIIDRLEKIPSTKTRMIVGDWILQIIQVTSTKIIKIKMQRKNGTPKKDQN